MMEGIEEAGVDFKEVRFVMGLLDEFIVWEDGWGVKEEIFLIVLSGGAGGWGR